MSESLRFWIERTPDRPLMAPEQIEAFNRRVYTILNMPPVLDLPDMLPRAEVEAQMRAYIPAHPRYDARGQLIESEFFENMLDQIALPDSIPVRFGLTTQRTDVRAFPTAQVVTSRPFEYALDRIQETSVDYGWPVAILASSGAWDFCLTPLYWGWVRAEHIASGSREQVAAYVKADPFVVTVAGRGLIAQFTGGDHADRPGITPQMGTRLPLRDVSEQAFQVSIPQRMSDETLHLVDGFAARQTGEFHEGYLPCTLHTLFRQAFKLLGEPYAWGDSRMGIFGRDCSRFVQDVYGTTGIRLPRNGNQQVQVCQTAAVFTLNMSDEKRKALLVDCAKPGALLFLPGHVMLYLGHINGEPYIIHDTSSGSYSEVVVSDLSLGADTSSGSLLHRLTEAATL